MKRMKLFAVAAILVAGASAFTGKAKPQAAGDYLSIKVAGNCSSSSGHRNDCEGSGDICEIDGVTFYQLTGCNTVLRKN